MAAQIPPSITTLSTQPYKLSASTPSLSDNQRIYQATLQKTLLAELEFLVDVVQGRVPDRKTIQTIVKEKLVQGLSTLLGFIPTIGSIMEAAANEAGSYLLGELEKKKREDESARLLGSFMELDSQKLKIITDDCAKEIACRWEMAINHFVEDQKGLMTFAATGAVRILEYLCRKRLPIEIEHLIRGVSAGCSGAGYLSFSNTQISLAKAQQIHWDNLKELSAEGLYGRSGYIVNGTFYIHDLTAGYT